MSSEGMGKLYIVGTPIGNLGDMSVRALETLQRADFIAAEDTRVTMKLLSHFGISKPLVSYYEHNMRQRGGEILSRILAGESCALTTDAGMPAISDPGGLLVAQCRSCGVKIEVVPGPCALVSAFALAGLESGRFCFEGFLSMNKRARREHLDALRGEKRAMIFYEAPHKLRATLDDFIDTFGTGRGLLIARELTKAHEESFRTTLGQAALLYEQTPPRGEFVLVIDGAGDEAEETEEGQAMSAAESLARELIDGGMPRAGAVKTASARYNVPKNALYDLIIEKD